MQQTSSKGLQEQARLGVKDDLLGIVQARHEETCCHSDSREKTLAEAYVKNLQGVISSSSSYRAGSTDIPDPLSPLLPIVHRPR